MGYICKVIRIGCVQVEYFAIAGTKLEGSVAVSAIIDVHIAKGFVAIVGYDYLPIRFLSFVNSYVFHPRAVIIAGPFINVDVCQSFIYVSGIFVVHSFA